MPCVSCALWATWTTFTSWRAPLLLGEWLHRQTLHLEERPLWKDLGWHQRDGVKCFQWHFPILPPIFGAMVPMVPMVPPFLAGSQHETSRSFSGHTGTSWADVHLVRSNAARNSFEILRWLKMMFLWFLYHNYYIFSPHPISVCIFLHYLFENTCWTKWIAMGSIVMRPFRGNSLCIHEGQPWGRKSPWSWEFKGLLTGESLKHQNYGFGKADPVGLLLGRVTWPDQWSSAQSVTMWEFGKWWLIIGITHYWNYRCSEGIPTSVTCRLSSYWRFLPKIQSSQVPNRFFLETPDATATSIIQHDGTCLLSHHGDNSPPGILWSALFSPDGLHILTASADCTARTLWAHGGLGEVGWGLLLGSIRSLWIYGYRMI